MKNRHLKSVYNTEGEERSKSYPHSSDFIYAASKAFATLLLGVTTISGVSAQTTKPHRPRVSSIDMVTGQTDQYHSGNETTGTTTTTTTTPSGTVITKITHSAKVNTPTAYIHGEDKYLKTKEEGHRYGEFDVYDINGRDKDQVVLGLLTNTLDRAKRFDDKGELDKKMTVATTMIEPMDATGNIIPGKKVRMSAIRFNDKIFVIIGENDYRYLDGKKIVGDTKISDALAKGKPVTEMTFFYELQNAGYAKNMSVKQWGEMSLNQKERVLNSSTMAGL